MSKMNKISRVIVVAALSLIGCQTPSPYDPGMECPRLENCGQCASRGGCTWCGDTTDGSRGLCMAIGRSECGSPNVLSKTPDQCALPPSGTPYAIPLPQAQVSAGASEVEKRIGPEKYKAIRNALTRAFPGAPISDDLIGQVNGILSRMPPPKPGQEAVKSREKEPITRPVWEKEHRLYVADAVHHRVKSMEPENKPMQSKFTKAVAMVRVPLPATITAENNRIETEIGTERRRTSDINGGVAHSGRERSLYHHHSELCPSAQDRRSDAGGALGQRGRAGCRGGTGDGRQLDRAAGEYAG